MKRNISIQIFAPILAFGVAGLVAGCASSTPHKEASVRVSLPELSGAARATVDKVTAGGHVDQIDKEFERGKLVYDVEATVGGKHVEYVIADTDGAVLGTETSIEYSDLPVAVRAAAEKFFGHATGLKAMKGVEYGETSYEVTGPKNGKAVEVTFTPEGKRAPYQIVSQGCLSTR